MVFIQLKLVFFYYINMVSGTMLEKSNKSNLRSEKKEKEKWPEWKIDNQ